MGAPALPPTWQLYLKDHRISTFKNWPFLEDCSCTPERMAEAGFIHCPTENEPDLAQCFFCFKELEGWEPDDNPMQRRPTTNRKSSRRPRGRSASPLSSWLPYAEPLLGNLDLSDMPRLSHLSQLSRPAWPPWCLTGDRDISKLDIR
nr:baculoviral IAP repeat-containing protein 5 isoform X1 [Rattus norvegicus]